MTGADLASAASLHSMATKRRRSRASRRSRHGNLTTSEIHALEERAISLHEELHRLRMQLRRTNLGTSVPRDDLGTLVVNLRVLAHRAQKVADGLAADYSIHG